MFYQEPACMYPMQFTLYEQVGVSLMPLPIEVSYNNGIVTYSKCNA